MRPNELIDMLKNLPPDANVVIAVVDPVDSDAEEISLRRYDLDLLLPEAEDGEAWLVVGEEADLDAFLDAIDSDSDDDDDDDDDHDHDHDDDDDDDNDDDDEGDDDKND